MNKDIDIFIPCGVDQFCHQIGFDLIDLVESLGFKANYNENQTCCGRILYDNGNWDMAKEVGEKFIEDFKGSNTVVGCSTSCIGYIKTKCANLFYNTSNHNSHKSLANRIMDITEFIHCVRPDCDLGAEFPFKVFLHNNCHSLNEYNVEQETRLILSKVKNLTLVNEEGNNFCCGWGSGLEIYNKAVSDELARRKIEYALSLGAQYITSTDTSCLLKLQNYIDKNNLDLKTIHIVSLLRYSSKNNNE
ncbi:MAG: (Fe-S)-binding protein [Bacteroidales bacterium]|nr:(Fe-S)-binding protein [Bacteroidales bacterium]